MATQDKVHPTSRAFRSAAGLPARKDDKVLSNAEPSGAKLATEPEGGYGGEDGISNSAAISASEKTGAENGERQAGEPGTEAPAFDDVTVDESVSGDKAELYERAYGSAESDEEE